MLAETNPDCSRMLHTAGRARGDGRRRLGANKKVFPNVDLYSGIIYQTLGMPEDLYTVLFAVSRVSGWTARVMEYLENNRIFRPRSLYIGEFNREYIPLDNR